MASPTPSTSESHIPWLTAEEQRAWRTFITADRWLFELLDRELKATHGISHEDYAILVSLSEAPDDRLRMSELADDVLQSRSRLSHHVGRLEARGLVARETCADDRRGLFAVLTPQGRVVIEAAAPDHVRGVRAHFIDQIDPQRLAALADDLAVVVDHLTSIRGSCPDADTGDACPESA
jgi:DNA-binding MarR family transcriptional regulator